MFDHGAFTALTKKVNDQVKLFNMFVFYVLWVEWGRKLRGWVLIDVFCNIKFIKSIHTTGTNVSLRNATLHFVMLSISIFIVLLYFRAIPTVQQKCDRILFQSVSRTKFHLKSVTGRRSSQFIAELYIQTASGDSS